AVKLSPSHRLYGLGAIMLVTLTICSRKFSSLGAPSFIVPLAVAGVAYLLAIREFLSTQILPKRVVVIGLVLAAVWHALLLLLLRLLRSRREGAHWVIAYAWHPLLATEVAGSGHIDIVGALLLVVSFAALVRRWRTVAALAFGLAVAVKLLPIVLPPLYWKRVRVRDGALAAIVCGLLYMPFLQRGQIPIGSLGTYVQSFRFNAPVFAALERVVAPQLVAGLAVLIGILTASWLRRRSEAWPSYAFAWPMAASILCAPVVYPWYMLWL